MKIWYKVYYEELVQYEDFVEAADELEAMEIFFEGIEDEVIMPTGASITNLEVEAFDGTGKVGLR